MGRAYRPVRGSPAVRSSNSSLPRWACWRRAVAVDIQQPHVELRVGQSLQALVSRPRFFHLGVIPYIAKKKHRTSHRKAINSFIRKNILSRIPDNLLLFRSWLKIFTVGVNGRPSHVTSRANKTLICLDKVPG